MGDILHAGRYSASVRSGVVSLAVLGALYALFSALLYAQGIAARAVWLPIAPERYYLAQALFVAPLFVLLAFVFARVARFLAGGPSDARTAFAGLAPRYAWPITICFLVPDMIVFLGWGHASLAPAMRYYGPLAPIVIVALSTRWLAREAGVGGLRATFAAIGALLAQAVVGGALLR
jgi:hypothetical protein